MIKNRVHEILKKPFFVSAMTLMSGTLLAQIITILISPVTTRLFSTEEIGIYTLVLTAVNMFGAVICLKYDMIIVSESDKDKVPKLIKLSFFILIACSFIVSIGYSIYCSFQSEVTIPYVLLVIWVFVLLFLTGCGNILTSYNNRNREYKTITKVSILRAIGWAIGIVAFGFLHSGYIGLLFSQCISCFLGLNIQARQLRNEKIQWREITNKDLKSLAIENRRQPLFSVPATFLNSFSYSVINLFITSLFGLSKLALYSMSFRMLGIPLSLISANMSKVYFEKASREYETTFSFRKTFIAISGLLSIVAVLLGISLACFAPTVFRLFYGPEWEEAGVYVQYLTPMFCIRLIVSALTPTMIIVKKQNIELIIQSGFLVGTLLVYLIIGNSYTIIEFISGISIMYCVIYVALYLVMYKLSKPSQIRRAS